MLIPDAFKKTVAFLFADVPSATGIPSKTTPLGTAFFVRVPIEGVPPELGIWMTYAVTALHVIRGAERYGGAYLRVNQKDRAYIDYPANKLNWHEHPSNDVAAVPFTLTPTADIVPLPVQGLATNLAVKSQELGEGDETFMVGLFSELSGKKQNLPVFRFGNIARMPYEQIEIRRDPSIATRVAVDAYLVEARSRGGLSGSPVFVYFPLNRRPGSIEITQDTTPFSLLGLTHGHYRVESASDMPFDETDNLGTSLINAGLVIVIPGQAIHDLLFSEELVAQRREALDRYEKTLPRAVLASDVTIV